MKLRPLVLFEIAALVAWLACAAFVVIRPGEAALVPLDARALATGPSAERWYGIFLQDQHIGFSVSRATPTAGGGMLYEQRSQLRMLTFGKVQEVVTVGAALTDPSARLSRFDFFLAGDAVRLAVQGEHRGDELVMRVDQAGEQQELRFPMSSPPQVGLSMEAVLARTTLAPGVTVRVPYFDPVTLQQGERELRVTDVEVLESGDEAWWLTSSFAGVETRALVSVTGETLREENAMGMSMVRMAPEAARAVPTNEAPADLIALTSVPLDGALPGDSRSLRTLTVQIAGVPPERVRDEPPLQARVGDRVTVTVPAWDTLPDEPDPALPPPPADTLAPTLTLPSAHPEIQSAAAEILAGAPTRKAKVAALVRWVFENVEKVPAIGVPNGLAVLRDRQGDCNEHTALFVTLARAAGVPARIAAGVVFSDRIAEKGAFYYHAWPEVWMGGETGWVPVDPTFGQVVADATHIKLVEGDLDRQVEIMAVMGRLRFVAEGAR